MIYVHNRIEQPSSLASWKSPAIVATSAVAIVGGFYLGGPGLGMAVGAMAAAAIVFMAARQVPQSPIVPAPLRDLRRHVLIVATRSLEDSDSVSQIARLCETPEAQVAEHEIRLLVPAPRGLLDRWSCDRRKSVELAQSYCLLSLASLAKAGLAGEARIGDEDVVLAVEDELRTYPATEVILVTGRAEPQHHVNEIASELRTRLRTDFLHLPSSTKCTLTSGDSAAKRGSGNG